MPHDFRSGERVTFVKPPAEGEPPSPTGVIRTWVEREKLYNSVKLGKGWGERWTEWRWYREELKIAREKDKKGELISVNWDGTGGFGHDGYDPLELKYIQN